MNAAVAPTREEEIILVMPRHDPRPFRGRPNGEMDHMVNIAGTPVLCKVRSDKRIYCTTSVNDLSENQRVRARGITGRMLADCLTTQPPVQGVGKGNKVAEFITEEQWLLEGGRLAASAARGVLAPEEAAVQQSEENHALKLALKRAVEQNEKNNPLSPEERAKMASLATSGPVGVPSPSKDVLRPGESPIPETATSEDTPPAATMTPQATGHQATGKGMPATDEEVMKVIVPIMARVVGKDSTVKEMLTKSGYPKKSIVESALGGAKVDHLNQLPRLWKNLIKAHAPADAPQPTGQQQQLDGQGNAASASDQDFLSRGTGGTRTMPSGDARSAAASDHNEGETSES